MRKSIPERGAPWETIRRELESFGKGDADWRSARTAVYVFNPGEDVMRVVKDAYAMYQSENGGPGSRTAQQPPRTELRTLSSMRTACSGSNQTWRSWTSSVVPPRERSGFRRASKG